jgi:hypothetical protein
MWAAVLWESNRSEQRRPDINASLYAPHKRVVKEGRRGEKTSQQKRRKVVDNILEGKRRGKSTPQIITWLRHGCGCPAEQLNRS